MKFTNRLLSYTESNNWNEAYPIGNGSLGAMVDGGLKHETIYFNEDSFWSGCDKNPNYRSNDVYAKIKQLSLENKIKEAEELLYKNVYGEYAESYLPLCQLHINRNIAKDSKYNRMLDLENGLVSMDNNSLKELSFISHTHKAYIQKIVSNKNLTQKVSLSSLVNNEIKYEKQDSHGFITAHLQAPSHLDPIGHPKEQPIIYDSEHPGVKAFIRVVIITDGSLVAKEDCIEISNASMSYIYLFATTNKDNKDYIKTTDTLAMSFHQLSFENILEDHIKDFESLYDKVSVSLTNDSLNENMDTVTALKKFYKHPDVTTLLFNYGRYLMISASREDSNCMNLQGLWNGVLQAPWSSAFTVNINIQMNYWIAEICGLSSCHMPLMRQLKVMAASGERTAKEQLDSDGWVCGHNSDIWGHTNLTGRISSFNPTCYALCLSGGAWLATHIFTHYEYTLDKEFLKEYYPILKGAAKFYLSYMSKDPESDYYVLAPSSSPENTYINNKERHSASKNATFDSSVARNIFRIIYECSNILDIDKDFAKECMEASAKLYPIKIGSKGEILEWYDNYKETEKIHRHLSHLYGLHPDNQITPEKTPELAKACEVTLKRRGNKGIGWSITWRANMYARLHKGDLALKALYEKQKLFNPKLSINYGGCYPNLFCAPPMQVDGNFGLASAVCEMLLQSHDGISILPALPSKWPNGSFNGLIAKGGYVVDCSWKDGKIATLKVSGKGDTLEVRIANKLIRIELNKEIIF